MIVSWAACVARSNTWLDAVITPDRGAGNRHRRLDRRARRVQTTQYAAEQRPVDGSAPASLEADAGDEYTWAEARLTDIASTSPVSTERNHCATTTAQCSFSGFQLRPGSERCLFAGNRIGTLDIAHAATGRWFPLRNRLDPVQFRARNARCRFCRWWVPQLTGSRLFSLLVDPPYVTHRVRKMRALR